KISVSFHAGPHEYHNSVTSVENDFCFSNCDSIYMAEFKFINLVFTSLMGDLIVYCVSEMNSSSSSCSSKANGGSFENVSYVMFISLLCYQY
uniref:Uncharacterized protein n=1 Tax=Glossina palpalis gambiensis TaxID=67801 RepID=A0A1B0C7K4_9MUSC